MLRFEIIDEDNFDECVKLKVSKEQSQVIASNLESLAEAYVMRDEAVARLIYDDDTPVGFILFLIDQEEEFFYIWRLMIDENMQGKGFGKKAMVMAIEFLKNEGAKKIQLSHRVDNPKPGVLYESLGFKYTGIIEDEERMMELVF